MGFDMVAIEADVCRRGRVHRQLHPRRSIAAYGIDAVGLAANYRARIENDQFSLELFEPGVTHVQVRAVTAYPPGDNLTVKAIPVFVGYQYLHLAGVRWLA